MYMNDKTRQRQKRGREPDEKIIFVCGDVRRWLLVAQLWNQIVKRCLATVTAHRDNYFPASSRLANQTSREMEVG